MTNSFRTIATAAATVAVTVALVGGIIAPAQAAPAGFPPIGPINPGPSVPPLPPGGYRPAVQFPSCSNIFTPVALAELRRQIPGFALGPNASGQYGTAVSALRPYIESGARTQTCTFLAGANRAYVTETAIGATTYTALKAWYDGHANESIAGGSATTPGTSIDTLYMYNPNLEQAIISPDGWWITIRFVGIDMRGFSGYDLVDQFLASNPLRR